MIALLDVDVLVALFDPAHLYHEAAHEWFASHRSTGWATCPITENGFVRTISHPAYPGNRVTVENAVERLTAFAAADDHHFWPDSTSLRRRSRLDTGLLEGSEQIRSAYLLLLAVDNDGRFVTFDPEVPLVAVSQATPEHLVVLDA
jgi:toxin-antitoxin system PIN domain toxin